MKLYLPIPKHLIKVSFGIIDQIILSGLNFLTAYFLIKTVTKIEYGYYNLFLPITLLFTAIQNAIINVPMMVLYFSKTDVEKKAYVSSLFYLQIYVLIPILIFTLLIGSILFYLSILSQNSFFLYLSLIIAIIGLLSREFLRNYYFTIEKPKGAVKNDFSYLLLFLTFVGLSFFTIGINVSLVFLFIGLSALISSIFRVCSIIQPYDILKIKSSIIENWIHGKWVLIGGLIAHIQNYSYIYLLGLFINAEIIGEISAAKLLLSPFALIAVGYSKTAIPRGNKLKNLKQVNKFFKEELMISVFILFFVFAYTVILYFTPIEFKSLILSANYISSFKFIFWFATSSALSFISQAATNGLIVMTKFEAISKINFITMIIVLGGAATLINDFGIAGALSSVIFGQTVSAILLWRLFIKAKNNH